MKVAEMVIGPSLKKSTRVHLAWGRESIDTRSISPRSVLRRAKLSCGRWPLLCYTLTINECSHTTLVFSFERKETEQFNVQLWSAHLSTRTDLFARERRS